MKLADLESKLDELESQFDYDESGIIYCMVDRDKLVEGLVKVYKEAEAKMERGPAGYQTIGRISQLIANCRCDLNAFDYHDV